jgi:hypothetical protein
MCPPDADYFPKYPEAKVRPERNCTQDTLGRLTSRHSWAILEEHGSQTHWITHTVISIDYTIVRFTLSTSNPHH